MKKCCKDNANAVPGTDLCRTHSGVRPQVRRWDALSDSVSKSLLTERISTKIEEWSESFHYDEQNPVNYDYEEGIIDGLQIALEIIDSTGPKP
jgi:hypothetical protein